MSEQPALLETGGSSDPRTSGPAQRGHSVQFYEDEAFLVETVTRYLAGALVLGESVFVIATPAHRARCREGLEAKGFDLARTTATGQLVMLDAAETLGKLMKSDEPDWKLFEAHVGALIERGIAASRARRARAFGEMVDLLWRDGKQQAALRLEAFWERLCSRNPLSLLCAYLMGHFYKESDAARFREVCGLHHHVPPPEGFAESHDRDAQMREVAFLQQRARALETELKRQALLEAQLRAAQEDADAAP